jgi:membrane protein
MYRQLRNNPWFRFWRTYIRPVVKTAVGLDRLTSGLLSRFIIAIYRFTRYGPHEAAALSYYALFSLFPLLLLVIVLSASILGSAAAGNQVSDVLSFFFPGQTADILQDAVKAAADQSSSVSILAIIVLVWSSANLFGNLEKVLGTAFGVSISRRIYERRLIGIIMIVTLTVFLVASLLTNVVFGLLDLLFLNRFNTWLRMASLFVPTAFNAAIFAMLYGFVPPIRLRWDAILPASLLGGLAFEFAKLGFVWYIGSLANITFVYGSVATVVAFMLWAFVTFCLIMICAEICRALDDWMEMTYPIPAEDEEIQLFVSRRRLADHRPQHMLPPPE